MIKDDVSKGWIMKQVMTKFGSLKIDNGGDTMICSDTIYYSANFGRYLYSSEPRFFILDSYSTVFCPVKTNWKALEPKTFQISQPVSFQIYPILSNINFNHMSYLPPQGQDQL